MPFHAGFDILQFPEAAMDWLKANTNLVWCGYYLAPAPNRETSSWMGRFAALSGRWGLLPIYVGQQDPRTGRGNYQPSSILTAQQGTADAGSACDLVSREGFPAGSFVYLDWEYGDLDGNGNDYIQAWISAVANDGRARPGIYCSHLVAPAIAGLIDSLNPTPATRFFCWRVQEADPHPFSGNVSSLPEIDPAGCGFAGAQVWQREQQAVVAFPDGAPVRSLMMDFSTSSLADPGAPVAAFFGTRALPTDFIASHRHRRGKIAKVTRSPGSRLSRQASAKKSASTPTANTNIRRKISPGPGHARRRPRHK